MVGELHLQMQIPSGLGCWWYMPAVRHFHPKKFLLAVACLMFMYQICSMAIHLWSCGCCSWQIQTAKPVLQELSNMSSSIRTFNPLKDLSYQIMINPKTYGSNQLATAQIHSATAAAAVTLHILGCFIIRALQLMKSSSKRKPYSIWSWAPVCSDNSTSITCRAICPGLHLSLSSISARLYAVLRCSRYLAGQSLPWASDWESMEWVQPCKV